MIPATRPPSSPPSAARMPATAPATRPTSPSPETLRAATAETTIGRPAISVSKTGVRPDRIGILLTASTSASAMKAGMLPTMMPRMLMRFQIDSDDGVAVWGAVLPPSDGWYGSFQYRARPEM